ncbi:PDZ domain-containing protein [Micromonospora sp. HM5-17]|jgi:PDZ domain-containing protein|uniref:YlbL family protein n=1 Tax=Micromonospora sp. HM5-17 TaxID=2487710 RepID=UPI000F498C55|nr:PDZ domain-containing protein [Micromonospora sp. HM5-17]ROT32227.1 PDZ domain-containing protein [Micromonospora sp. HM5-17]
MRRRGVTVLLGAVITALLSLGVLAAPIPYVVLGPGPTVDTLGRQDDKEVIQVSGRETSTSAGQLRLTTVGVQPDVKLLTAIAGWLSSDEAVVPYELIYPPGETQQEVERRNAEDFAASQTSAETAALRELGYPVQVVVKNVVAGGASEGILKAGDIITSVDDKPVPTAGTLTRLVQAQPAGTALTIGYTRDGAPATATIVTRATDGGPPRIGVEVEQRQPHPFDLKIDLGNIGGPSAGLMFALGIIDKLTAEDLTGGRIIAGTGTINDEGEVGPIGGIPQKLVGAKRAGATYFLVPADNCAEAVRNAQPGLPMARVATLQDALAALATIRAGGEPPHC